MIKETILLLAWTEEKVVAKTVATFDLAMILLPSNNIVTCYH